MTSRKSLANNSSAKYDLKCSFKLNLLPALLMLFWAIEYILIPIFENFVQLDFYESASENTKTAVCTLTGSGFNSDMPMFCILSGVLFGLLSLVFMKKTSVNFHFSLPVDRATMFKNRVVSAVTYIVGIFAVVISIDIIVNVVEYGNPAYIVKLALALFSECLVYTLVAFAITLIAIYSCYTVIESVLFVPALLLLPTVLMFAVSSIMNKFLKGYGANTAISTLMYSENTLLSRSLLVTLANFNPLLWGKAIGSDRLSDTVFSLCYNSKDNTVLYSGFEKFEYTLPNFNYILPIIAWAVVFVALMLVAKRIFVNRKLEKTELHSSNIAVTTLFAAEVSLGCSVWASSVLEFMEKDKIETILIMVVVFIIIYYIITAVSKRKPVLNKSSYLRGAAFGVALAVVCGSFILAGNSYGNYVPNVDDIATATITSGGYVNKFQNQAQHSDWDLQPMNEYQLDVVAIFSETDDIEKLTNVAEGLTKSTDNMVQTNITVVYNLKNGKRVCRNYTSVDADSLYSIASLTDTNAYNKQLAYYLLNEGDDSIFTDEKLGVDDEFFAGVYYDEYNNKNSIDNGEASFGHYALNDDVKIENTSQLKQAIYDDLTSMSYDEIYKPAENEVGRVKFTSYYTQYEDYEDSLDDVLVKEEVAPVVYRIYPSMKNTVAYLKSIGVYSENSEFVTKQPTSAYIISAEDIYKLNGNIYFPNTYMFESYIPSTNVYDEYTLVTDYYGDQKVTDADKLQQLKDYSRMYKYASKDDLIVLFVFDDEYIPALIPAENVPDWAK